MQQVCLLFAGRRGLDDFEIRNSILRIPEVSRRVRQAQRVIDCLDMETPVDLLAYLLSGDEDYNQKPALRSLVSSVVQVGLFDRYVKFRSRPEYLIGRMNGSSALKVCSDQMSFEDFLSTSEFLQEKAQSQSLPTDTLLAGASLEEYGTYRWNYQMGCYEEFSMQARDAVKIIEELDQENLINQCIHIGPCYEFREQELASKGVNHLPSMSSIDLDPILTSFWKKVI